MAVITLKHATSGLVKQVPVGFSWTTLLFGAFVPLLRGDIKWFIIFMVVSILTVGLAWFVIPFVYNKIYIKELLQRGFVPADEFSKNYLVQKGLIIGNNTTNSSDILDSSKEN